MRLAWEQRDGCAAAAAVSDAILEGLFVFGDAARCRTQLQAYPAAGVRRLLVLPLSARAGPRRRDALLSTIEFAARQFANA